MEGDELVLGKEIVHQNIVIDGVDLGNPGRVGSNFCNEGKWKNFIEPLIPEGDYSDMTLVELGCNAGLFLRLAKEKGFRDVIGVEKSNRTYKEALRYRESLKMDYKLINQTIREGFDYDQLPVADITLMANFHYHLDIPDFFYLLDKLKQKTVYCLVVSADDGKEKHWRPDKEITHLRNYFKDWECVKAVYGIRVKDDPHPRPMWSVLFRSELRRVNLADIYNPKNWKKPEFKPPREMAKIIHENPYIENIRELSYYDKILSYRDKIWTEEMICNYLQGKIDLMYDIKNNGQIKPIFIRHDRRLMDGNHRMIMLRELGYKSVICRII